MLERADGTMAGVVIKASASVGASDFTALQDLRDRLGARFIAGVVLYTGDTLIPSGDRLWLVPLPALWGE